jgi:hypothetical protein
VPNSSAYLGESTTLYEKAFLHRDPKIVVPFHSVPLVMSRVSNPMYNGEIVSEDMVRGAECRSVSSRGSDVSTVHGNTGQLNSDDTRAAALMQQLSYPTADRNNLAMK